jgi:hypothetical protein
MSEQETLFEKMVPMKSVLGREFLSLQSERDKQKAAFEASKDPLAVDTQPYRRAGIALEKFLESTLPLVMAAQLKLQEAKEGLETAEEKAQRNNSHGIVLDRRSIQIIWTRFALERYRAVLPKTERKKLKAFHPGLYQDIGQAFKKFRFEIKRWQYGGQPFDGSQAMHSMIAFQLKARLLGAAND